jgi:hypothetical protein
MADTLRAIATRVNATKPDNPDVTLEDLVRVALLQLAMKNIREGGDLPENRIPTSKVSISRLVIQDVENFGDKIFELVSYDSNISIDSNDSEIIEATTKAFELFTKD